MSILVVNKLILNLLYVYFTKCYRIYKYASDSMNYSGLKKIFLYMHVTHNEWLFTYNIFVVVIQFSYRIYYLIMIHIAVKEERKS